MKLSVQFLQKSIDNNSANVKELAGNVAKTLIEQIDHLSKIAFDFSQFANIGNTKIETFDINDVINLIPALTFVPGADTSRIGMYGWSRGGMMTYLALSKTTRIKAAVIGAGMTDAFMTIHNRPEMETSVFAELIPRYKENRDTALRQRSAVYWPEKINKTTPLLILHGSADWRVAPEEALRLVNLLYKVKHPLRFVLFEGGQHSLVEHTEEVRRVSKLFLDNYLRDRRPWPNLELHGN